MDTSSVIWNYQKEIVEIYKKENLNSLCGIDLSYELNGKNILEWFHEVTHKNGAKRNLGSLYYELQTDLFTCSDEMIYFTAHLYLYKPFINNPLLDSVIFNGKEIFPNNQNLETKRYSMFADIVSQKTYNYWDRIGDLIATFYPEKFKSKNIYFSNSLDFIPADLQASPNYIWLKDFKETEYKELNQKRKQIVHYQTTNTEYIQRHLKTIHDRDSIERLQTLRESLPDYYKKQISLSITGFEKTLSLLGEINTLLF